MQGIITQGIEYAQLIEDVRAVVRHELQTNGPSPAAATEPSDELLTIRQAATYMGVCVATIHDWKKRGLLTYHKMGGRSYLKKAEMLAALTSQQRTVKAGKGKAAQKGGTSRG
jgi:excisionase family DNA binding protein